jgi:hypothetical protein
MNILFSQQHLLKRLFFLHCVEISWLQMHEFTSGSSILIRWSSCLFLMPIPCCFYCYGSVA